MQGDTVNDYLEVTGINWVYLGDTGYTSTLPITSRLSMSPPSPTFQFYLYPVSFPATHTIWMLHSSLTKQPQVPWWFLPLLFLPCPHLENSSVPFKIFLCIIFRETSPSFPQIGLGDHSGMIANNKHALLCIIPICLLVFLPCAARVSWSSVRQWLHPIHLWFPVTLCYCNKCQLD